MIQPRLTLLIALWSIVIGLSTLTVNEREAQVSELSIINVPLNQLISDVIIVGKVTNQSKVKKLTEVTIEIRQILFKDDRLGWWNAKIGDHVKVIDEQEHAEERPNAIVRAYPSPKKISELKKGQEFIFFVTPNGTTDFTKPDRLFLNSRAIENTSKLPEVKKAIQERNAPSTK